MFFELTGDFLLTEPLGRFESIDTVQAAASSSPRPAACDSELGMLDAEVHTNTRTASRCAAPVSFSLLPTVTPPPIPVASKLELCPFMPLLSVPVETAMSSKKKTDTAKLKKRKRSEVDSEKEGSVRSVPVRLQLILSSAVGDLVLTNSCHSGLLKKKASELIKLFLNKYADKLVPSSTKPADKAKLIAYQSQKLYLRVGGKCMTPSMTLSDCGIEATSTKVARRNIESACVTSESIPIQVCGIEFFQQESTDQFVSSLTELVFNIGSKAPGEGAIRSLSNGLTANVNIEECFRQLMMSNHWSLAHEAMQLLSSSSLQSISADTRKELLTHVAQEDTHINLIMNLIQHEHSLCLSDIIAPSDFRGTIECKENEEAEDEFPMQTEPVFGFFPVAEFYALESAHRARNERPSAWHQVAPRLLNLSPPPLSDPPLSHSISPTPSIGESIGEMILMTSLNHETFSDEIADVPMVPAFLTSESFPLHKSQLVPRIDRKCLINPMDLKGVRARRTLAEVTTSVKHYVGAISFNPAACTRLIVKFLLLLLSRLQSMQPLPTLTRKPLVLEHSTLLLSAMTVATKAFAGHYTKSCDDNRSIFSEDCRWDVFHLIARCLSVPGAPITNIGLVQDLCFLLRCFSEFAPSHRVHNNDRMLPPILTAADRKKALTFRPMRLPAFDREADYVQQHLKAKQEVCSKSKAMVDKKVSAGVTFAAVRELDIDRELTRELDEASARLLLRRLVHFAHSTLPISRDARAGIFPAIYVVQQLAGFNMFKFTQSLILDSMYNAIDMYCRPLFESLETQFRCPTNIRIRTNIVNPTLEAVLRGSMKDARSNTSSQPMQCDSIQNPIRELHDELLLSPNEEAELIAWERERDYYHSIDPIAKHKPSSSATPAESLQLLAETCNVTFRNLLHNLRNGGGCKSFVAQNAQQLRHFQTTQGGLLLKYLAAWNEAYEMMKHNETGSNRELQPMEVDADQQSIQFSLGPADDSVTVPASPISSVEDLTRADIASHCDTPAPAAPVPNLLRLNHYFDSHIDTLGHPCGGLMNKNDTSPLINQWLQNVLRATEDHADVEAFNQLCQEKSMSGMFCRFLHTLDNCLTKLQSHVAFELQLAGANGFVLGRSALASLSSKFVKLLPTMTGSLLPILTLFAYNEPLFENSMIAIRAWRDLVEKHADLFNIFVACDPRILRDELLFLMCGDFTVRPSRTPKLQHQQSISTRLGLPTPQPHILSYFVKEHFLDFFLPKIQLGCGYASKHVSINIKKRDNVLSESLAEINKLTSMPESLSVVFAGEPGTGPGVAREFLQLVARQLFQTKAAVDPITGEAMALFIPSPSDPCLFAPNPQASLASHLDSFRFAGRVFALALMSRLKLEFGLSPAAMQYVLSGHNIDWRRHLACFDQDLYNQFVQLMDDDVDVSEYGLCFVATVPNVLTGKNEEVELIPNGAAVEVTNYNRHEYIQLYTQMRLIGSIKPQLDAMKQGFTDWIPNHPLRMLTEVELQIYFNGLSKIEVKDWKRHTSYSGFKEQDAVIQWFWQIVDQDLSDIQRANLLYFACSIARVPAGGFAALAKTGSSGFRITKAASNHNVTQKGIDGQYPSAHTCFLELVLPNFSSKQVLKDKLLDICQQRAHAEGFGTI